MSRELLAAVKTWHSLPLMKESKMSENVIYLEDHERQPCEIWSRVMGYHRPISEWNHGKKQEFEERKKVDVKKVEKKIDEMQKAA